MKPKIFYLLILLSIVSSNTFAQKLYVWCPNEQSITPRNNFLENDTIDVVMFDGRILPKNSKIECISEDIMAQIDNVIKQAYPNAITNLIASSEYYKDPLKNRITIKIGISAYHAAFGADVKIGIGSIGGNFSYGVFPEGKWNAITAYTIKIYDYRNGKEEKSVKDIYKIESKSNLFGYSTAKSCLNITYTEANQDMLLFIDNTLMK